jgi:hypothetical protein
MDGAAGDDSHQFPGFCNSSRKRYNCPVSYRAEQLGALLLAPEITLLWAPASIFWLGKRPVAGLVVLSASPLARFALVALLVTKIWTQPFYSHIMLSKSRGF